MSLMTDVHRKAMDFAAKGLMARMRGDTEEAVAHFEEALENELVALDELDRLGNKVEPTYSVLHRSAATLALDCHHFRLAEKLASKALAADPVPAIADELRDVWEQANSYRHLELKGVKLEPDEMQVSLSGGEVGLGFVRFSDLATRLENTSKLIGRTVERLVGRPFRERGRVPRDLAEACETYVSTPRAASFALTVKLTSDREDRYGINASTVFNEFMDLIQFVNNGENYEIHERIPDSKYLDNFLSLARKIAPDGDRVRQVSFTSVTRGEQRAVTFTRLPHNIIHPSSDLQIGPSIPAEQHSLIGTLQGADVTQRTGGLVKIVDDDGKTHNVRVPKRLVHSIVRPMWHSRVVVEYTRRANRMVLDGIYPHL